MLTLVHVPLKEDVTYKPKMTIKKYANDIKSSKDKCKEVRIKASGKRKQKNDRTNNKQIQSWLFGGEKNLSDNLTEKKGRNLKLQYKNICIGIF